MSNLLQCPKCHGTMRTYDRYGVHIEQCDGCRGVFLDYGELEALSRMEAQSVAPPPGYGAQPGWGAPQGYGHGGHGHRKNRGFGQMLFSS
jgi:Zn-finger nucleic acid-binding protein